MAEAARTLDLAEVMGLVPWNGCPYNQDKPDGNMRELIFSPGSPGSPARDSR